MRVADFIVQTLELNGIDTSFSITGGFSMHLNDSFGRSSFAVHYQHHEQACGYSAVGYTRASGKPSVVCTTAGVAATNAISPCLVAYQDSVSVLFISGQANSHETIRTLNTDTMKLRHYAGADCDIISAVAGITKFSHEVTCVDELPVVLEKTLAALTTGRSGPVWLSIPLNIQAMNIDVPISTQTVTTRPNQRVDVSELHAMLRTARRPLLLLGNGVHLARCRSELRAFLARYPIPCVFTMMSTDLLETANVLSVGKVGLIGDRCGNFAIQNCDLLISLGCRMAQGVIGYRPDWFSRESKRAIVDNDDNELQKTNIRYDLKISGGLQDFFSSFGSPILPTYDTWIEKCGHWKSRWLFEQPPVDMSQPINPYPALKMFYHIAPSNKITVASSGSIVTNAWHMVNVKEGDQFILSSQGDMGFELPAAIGAKIAYPEKCVVSILGEGSLQLNIQELQTIVHNRIPVKILVFNNASYGANVITQANFFGKKVGCDPSSGISFPDTEKVANAYGIEYISTKTYEEMEQSFKTFLEYAGPVIHEVFCCIQPRHPKLAAMKNDDGTFTNRPFEDMYPFLDRQDLQAEMIIPVV